MDANHMIPFVFSHTHTALNSCLFCHFLYCTGLYDRWEYDCEVCSMKKRSKLTFLLWNTKRSFHLLRKCFFFVFVTFAYVARTTPKTSPGKLTKLRTIKKKMKTLKSFKFSVLFWKFLYGIHSYTLFTHFRRVTASESIPISRKTPKTGALERSRTSEFLEKRCKKNQPNFFFILKYSKTCFHFVFHLYSVTTHVFHHHVQFSCSYQHSGVPHVFPTPFLCNPAIHDWFPSSCWCLLVGFTSVTITFWSLSPSFTAIFHLFSRFNPL